MREIKFRAWDDKKNKFVGVVDISQHRKYWEFDLGLDDNLITQQFTGLIDKNGKEIYEGDIVSFPWISPTGEPEAKHSYYGNVVFEDGAYFMKPIKSDSGYWRNQLLYRLLFVNTEVIGNIFENPDLLTSHKA